MLVKFFALALCFAICMGISARVGHGQETVMVALTSKAFQYTILPIAQLKYSHCLFSYALT